jgi:hypothetical protein
MNGWDIVIAAFPAMEQTAIELEQEEITKTFDKIISAMENINNSLEKILGGEE